MVSLRWSFREPVGNRFRNWTNPLSSRLGDLWVPFAVLLGYMTGPTLGKLGLKGKNALALVQHLGVLVTLLPLSRLRPVLLVPGLLAAVLVQGYPWW